MQENCAAPRSASDVTSSATADGAVAADRKPRLNALILDDSYADFDAMRRALGRLESFAVTVTRAKNLEEARRARHDQQFDVAFIDFNLGAESGARFLDEIGGRGSATIPILVTGLPDRRVQDIALNAGALGIVNKADITPLLLETTIRSALFTRQVESRLQGIISAMAAAGGR